MTTKKPCYSGGICPVCDCCICISTKELKHLSPQARKLLLKALS